jgi:hypothetical protein
LNAWPKKPEDAPIPAEYTKEQEDKTSVFLCRLAIKANNNPQAGKPPVRPVTLSQESVVVDNAMRLFVYNSQALAHMLDLV